MDLNGSEGGAPIRRDSYQPLEPGLYESQSKSRGLFLVREEDSNWVYDVEGKLYQNGSMRFHRGSSFIKLSEDDKTSLRIYNHWVGLMLEGIVPPSLKGESEGNKRQIIKGVLSS